MTQRANGGSSVSFSGSSTGNTVGGTTIGKRNIISGNNVAGVFLNTSSNTVTGNYIRVAADGVLARGNANGILIDGNSPFTATNSRLEVISPATGT